MTHLKNNEYAKKWREAHADKYRAKNISNSKRRYSWIKVSREFRQIDASYFS